jgi:Lon protease-like protein
MFPLSTVLFPHSRLPLHVFEPRYRRLVDDVLAGDGRFGVVLIARGPEVGGGDDRTDLGTVATVEAAEALPDGRWLLVARGLERLRVTRWLPDDPYPAAMVETLRSPPTADGPALLAAVAALRQVLALRSELGETPAPALDQAIGDGPDEVGWRLCALAPVNPLDRQRLLETDDPDERLATLGTLVGAVAEDLRRMLSHG